MIRNNIHIILATAAVLAVTLIAAPQADAGVYRVYSCKTPDGAVMPTDGWSGEQHGGLFSYPYNTCPTGGVLGAMINGDTEQPSDSNVSQHFAAPADTQIRAFQAWRSARVTSYAENYATPLTYLSWPGPNLSPDAREYCVAGWGCSGMGTPGSVAAPENHVEFSGLDGVHDLYFAAACGGTNPCRDRNSPTPMAEFQIQAFMADFEDTTNPIASDVAGSLTGPGPHYGTASLAFNARDTGSGVYRTFVELKRQGAADYSTIASQVVDDNGGRCKDIGVRGGDGRDFAYRVPCKLTASGTVDVDTTKIANGQHDIRVSVEDAAGNRSTVYGPTGFRVINATDASGGPSLLGTPVNGVNASNAARIVVSKYARRHRKLRFGQRLRSVSTLRNEQGQPIANAEVTVFQRLRRPRATWRAARKPIRTGSSGRLRWTIPAGPSRTIRFAYKANPDNTRFQSISDLGLVVRSKTTLKRNHRSYRNAQTIRFSGRLKSRPVPKSGVLIDLQAKVGRKWQTFATKRTRSSGRWAIRYRFHSTHGTQRYAFRARVRQDSAYPYASSRSKTMHVIVRG